MPTILEMAEAKMPPTVEGSSFLPLMKGEETRTREIVVSAMGLIPRRGRATDTHTMTITSDEWALIAVRPDTKGSIKMKKDSQPQLYHLPSDPAQSKNLYDEEKDVATDLYSGMIQFLEDKKASKEILKLWRT